MVLPNRRLRATWPRRSLAARSTSCSRGPRPAADMTKGRRGSDGLSRSVRPWGASGLLEPTLAGLDDEGRARERPEDQDDPERLSLEDGFHHQSHRIPAPTLSAREARTVTAQVIRANLPFTIDPLRTKSWSLLDRQPGGLLRDPWLCVPASRRVCPGRTECGSSVPRTRTVEHTRIVLDAPEVPVTDGVGRRCRRATAAATASQDGVRRREAAPSRSRSQAAQRPRRASPSRSRARSRPRSGRPRC
jgi:hypothetical protein